MNYEQLSPLAAAYVAEIIETRAFLPVVHFEYDKDDARIPDEDAETYASWEHIAGENFDEGSLDEIEADCALVLASLERVGLTGPDRPYSGDILALAKALWEYRGGPGYDETVFEDEDEDMNQAIRDAAERLGAAEAGVMPNGTAFHRSRER